MFGFLRNPWFFVAVPLSLWSVHAVFSRMLMLDGRGAFEVLFLRSLGAILFGVAILRTHPFPSWKIFCTLPGIFCVTNFICFNLALKYLNSYLVMILETSCFVFSLLFSLLARDRFRVYYPAVGLYLLGLGLLCWNVSGHHNPDLAIGLFWGIMTAATFGCLNSTLRRTPGNAPTLYALMAPCLIFSIPVTIMEYVVRPPELLPLLFVILVLGVVLTGVSYYFWGKAAQHFPGVRLSELFLLTLPGTFLVEYVFLDMHITLLEFGAATILIVATALNLMQTCDKVTSL